MDNQDYIRAGVELANGWVLQFDELDELYWIESPTFTCQLDKIHTEMKDALAAQLARQRLARNPDAIIQYSTDVMKTIRRLVDES